MKRSPSGRYRKKPVVIEAFQWTPEHYGMETWPEWLKDAGSKERGEAGRFTIAEVFAGVPRGVSIMTLEGEQIVLPDDWIIRGVQGELYPCKPNIFEQTYEPDEEPDAASDH